MSLKIKTIRTTCVFILLFLFKGLYSQESVNPGNKTISVPKLYEPGVLSTSLDELNACFTPDGKTVFISINAIGNKFSVIMQSDYKNGKWTQPRMAPFSTGIDTDYDPFISPDGKRLFFISNRTDPSTKYSRKNFDIYYVDLENGKWSNKAQNIGPVINDAGEQYFPSVSRNGNLYFSANKDSSFDIYCSRYENAVYTKPFKLPGQLNTPTQEIDNCISPDEDFIIFSGYGRRDSKGSGDLYISFNNDGVWSNAVNLGDTINTKSREYCPILSPDRKYLFWTSTIGVFDDELKTPITSFSQLEKLYNGVLNGLGNIYQISLDKKLLDSLRSRVK